LNSQIFSYTQLCTIVSAVEWTKRWHISSMRSYCCYGPSRGGCKLFFQRAFEADRSYNHFEWSPRHSNGDQGEICCRHPSEGGSAHCTFVGLQNVGYVD